jgi:hypothetical protein
MVLRRAAVECPKKVAGLVNLPTALREFVGGQSQMSHLTFFRRVWSYIKDNKLQACASVCRFIRQFSNEFTYITQCLLGSLLGQDLVHPQFFFRKIGYYLPCS